MIEMGESISLDIELYRQDLRGSIAHARMLKRIGLLSASELQKMEQGLRCIKKEIEAGALPLRPELEDIHTHVEQRLIELAGEAGRRLHTARSRNDQIALDTHLFIRSSAHQLAVEILQLCEALWQRAGQETKTLLPGYTHLQVGQPVRLSHHLLAHFWAFLRDVQRFADSAEAANSLPLGSGAMAGVNYKNDKKFLQKELNFGNIYPNSMDAVSNRDHILDFIFAASLFVSHASRLAEEIILWNSQQFSFASLPDHLTTGSSIMPQKKNPDLAELIRAKSGRVQSHLQNLFTNLKALPLTYNRDLQEDRFPMIDSLRQGLLVARGLTAMIEEIQFHAERMQAALKRGFSTATDLADALVAEKKLPFRQAHHVVGQLVRYSLEKGKNLDQLLPAERGSIYPDLSDDNFYYPAISLDRSAEKKLSAGGTSLAAQKRQLKMAAKALSQWRRYNWQLPDYDF